MPGSKSGRGTGLMVSKLRMWVKRRSRERSRCIRVWPRHRPDDDHRVRQPPLEDLGVAGEPLLGPQPVAQQLLELFHRRPFAGGVEPGLGVQRSDEAVVWLVEPGVAELGEPGFLADPLHQRLAFEHRALGDAGPAG